MAISPLTYSTTSFMTRQLGELRSQMEGLERQLASGQRADSYGTLGRERQLSLAFRQEQTRIAAFQETITIADVRLSAIGTTLDRMAAIGRDAKTALDANRFLVQQDGTTADQKAARNYLEEMAALLNSDVGGRYVFSGKAVDERPVETLDRIFAGDGAQAGLRQVTAERLEADRGADGLGRLALSPVAGSTVTLTQEANGLPFGFRLEAATGTLSNAAVSGPAGAPAAVAVAFAGQPQIGEAVTLTLGLPDGSSHTLTLTAATDGAAGSFAIGATAADTAANFRAALGAALATAGDTALTAASGLAASRAFFATGPEAVASRVDGPPFASATALRPATAADTLQWYKGDNDAGPARSDATARVDAQLNVQYGLRANEAAFGAVFADLAALVVQDFSAGSGVESGRSSEMLNRLKSRLDGGADGIESVAMDIAGAHRGLDQARERHKAAEGTLATLLGDVEGADRNEVAVQLLELQTRMQASYEATAILYRLNLTDYL